MRFDLACCLIFFVAITTVVNINLPNLKESAKLRAMSAIRAYVFCVLSCFACLACLRALRALRASKICVPCVLTCFALIVISKFTCQYNTAESNSHSV